MCSQERVQVESARLQRLEEQADVVELLRVRRVLQEVDGFLVGGQFFFRNVLEAKVLVRAFIRKQHTIVEGVLGTEVVSEHDVREFVRKHCSEAGLVGKDVHQAAADHNGIAHAERFQRSREQDACANWTR